jgi:uncharacterized protein with ParB-like and HNH nuclease domain
MKVTQSPISLQDLLIEYSVFKVPRYQREYSWDNQQFSDLFYDITYSDEDYGHFFGSILIYCDSEKKATAEIIDGQQRLTTFFLLLKAIKDVLTEYQTTTTKIEKRVKIAIEDALREIDTRIFSTPKKINIKNSSSTPRLVTGKRDKELFSEIIKDRGPQNNKGISLASHQKMIKASQFYFKKHLKEILQHEKIEGVIEFLNKVFASHFIVMTAENNADKILLFKTLNARGLELAQSDLIKNEICNAVEENEIDNIIDIWDDIKSIIEKAKGDIDAFLFHYLNSHKDSKKIRKEIELSKNNSKKLSYSPPIPEKCVFEAFEYLLKNSNDTNELINEIKERAEEYVGFINPDNKTLSFKSLIGIKTLNITKCYPLLIAGKIVFNDKDFAKLAQSIEIISFKHSILKEDPKELEKLYYQVIDIIYSSQDVKKAIEKIKTHQSFSSTKFDEFFTGATPKSIVSKYILFRLTDHNKEPLDWGNKQVHLEHIMPQKSAGQWDKLKKNDPEKYDAYLNRIGNLTLLVGDKNIAISNKDFSEKKKIYKKYSLVSITNDLNNIPDWNYIEIEKRQKKLLAIAQKVWTM